MLQTLKPTIECLADETVLIQAWKKTANYIRYHNWFSDTLELDRTSINLREFIAVLASEIRSGRPLLSEPLRIVPAPKTQTWRVDETGRWGPADGEEASAKIRPLAHVSLRDQVISTALMMCLADRAEALQGDPTTPVESDRRVNVVSYGNRLYCDWTGRQPSQRWGASTLYRGFFEDYQAFLTRPEIIAEKVHAPGLRTLVVQSDLRQFYDRVTAKLLQIGIQQLRRTDDDPAFFDVAEAFLSWRWHDDDQNDARIYADQAGLKDFDRVVLPQGLVAAGFFANLALTTFDQQMRDQVGSDILSDVRLHDVARYVDDLRFVLSAPSDSSIEDLRSNILEWITRTLEQTAPGLSAAADKTKLSAFRADERPLVQQSRRMARIQAAISGGFDPLAGGEILDSVLALVRAQERLSERETAVSHDPFRPVPDVRDATVDRFVAGRFRTTFRSLRPQLWKDEAEQRAERRLDEDDPFGAARTRKDLDDETRAFALELLSKWVSDPSNVRLLRIGLDLWPAPDVLERVLKLLRPFTETGQPSDAAQRVAWYCLAELFRAGSAETGVVEDDEQLPNDVDVDAYRALLRREAMQILTVRSRHAPWYLKQQACLLVAADPQAPSLSALKTGELAHYGKLLQFLSGDDRKSTTIDFATHAVLARRSFRSAEMALQLVGPRLNAARLNRIAWLDPNFASELVARTGRTSLLKPRTRADLGLAGDATLGRFVLSAETRETLRAERPLLSFASKFLEALEHDGSDSAISPSQLSIALTPDRLEVQSVRIQPRRLAGPSLYDPPAWVSAKEFWRFQLGFLLRFILTAQPDFTKQARPPHWKEDEQIYRVPPGHWHERIFGFFNGHSAFGDDWLPITDWTERLLFGLLWWPGCAIPRQRSLVTDLPGTRSAIEARLAELRSLQGASATLVPICVPGVFRREGKPLRGCVVQMCFPTEEDFQENDLTMSAGLLRVRERRHLSAALAAVRSALALRETHNELDGRLDWLILPELAVHPDDVRTHLVPFARQHKTVIFTGLTYERLFSDQPLVNSGLWILPTQDGSRGLQVLIRRQGKKHLAPSERDYEAAGLVQSFRPGQWLIGYTWSTAPGAEPLWLTAAICFDATDLCLAADLKNRSDVFAVSAMNRDVNTFDNMALALHYHMHQMVIVANNGNYGGSSGYAPYSNAIARRVFHVHGQPQASIAFFEITDIAGFKNRGSGVGFKPRPAG